MNLNNYILVRCFEKQEYEQQFNSGKPYINSTKHYWKSENAFQQDKEGEALTISENDSQDYILTINGKNVQFKELSIRLDGYIMCFYLLPKFALKIDKSLSTFDIIDEKEKEDFEIFIKNYLNELKKGEPHIKRAFVTFYDAELFCDLIKREMTTKGFEVSCGKVSYRNLTQIEKDKLCLEHGCKMLVFTKPESYKYQKEFRFFLLPNSIKNYATKDHIEEYVNGIDKTIILGFNYTLD